jgi:hypothetical protein
VWDHPSVRAAPKQIVCRHVVETTVREDGVVVNNYCNQELFDSAKTAGDHLRNESESRQPRFLSLMMRRLSTQHVEERCFWAVCSVSNRRARKLRHAAMGAASRGRAERDQCLLSNAASCHALGATDFARSTCTNCSVRRSETPPIVYEVKLGETLSLDNTIAGTSPTVLVVS